jgi:hypothetical protein
MGHYRLLACGARPPRNHKFFNPGARRAVPLNISCRNEVLFIIIWPPRPQLCRECDEASTLRYPVA